MQKIKSDKNFSKEMKKILCKKINTTIDEEIIKSLKGENNDLIPMKKHKEKKKNAKNN